MASGQGQKKSIDFEETYPPVVKFVSLHILLTIMAVRDWDNDQDEIVISFLHRDLDENIYMTTQASINPPEGDQVLYH